MKRLIIFGTIFILCSCTLEEEIKGLKMQILQHFNSLNNEAAMDRLSMFEWKLSKIRDEMPYKARLIDCYLYDENAIVIEKIQCKNKKEEFIRGKLKEIPCKYESDFYFKGDRNPFCRKCGGIFNLKGLSEDEIRLKYKVRAIKKALEIEKEGEFPKAIVRYVREVHHYDEHPILELRSEEEKNVDKMIETGIYRVVRRALGEIEFSFEGGALKIIGKPRERPMH
jgi:hypothetical protein